MISFIVPAYNVEKYIGKCLDSLIPFINDGHEIIIINDGSTDNTPNIIQQYKRLYPSLKIIHQENKGLSGARNTGLEFASKKYVWFIDSDDFLTYSETIDILSILEEDYDLISFGRKEIYKDKTRNVPKLKSEKFITGIDYFVDAINKGYYRTNVWDKIYRREILQRENIRFIEGLVYEDMYFNLLYQLVAKNVKILPIYPYNYIKINTDSISSKIKIKDLDVLVFIKMAYNLYTPFLKDNLPIQNAFYQLIFNWVSSCLMNKYIPLSSHNKTALHIVNKTLSDKYFLESVYYCSVNKVRFRFKLFSKLLLFSHSLYKLILKSALSFSRLLQKI